MGGEEKGVFNVQNVRKVLCFPNALQTNTFYLFPKKKKGRKRVKRLERYEGLCCRLLNFKERSGEGSSLSLKTHTQINAYMSPKEGRK
jgi:hypothetical protein